MSVLHGTGEQRDITTVDKSPTVLEEAGLIQLPPSPSSSVKPMDISAIQIILQIEGQLLHYEDLDRINLTPLPPILWLSPSEISAIETLSVQGVFGNNNN